ncbi:hypothetical protein GGI20_001261 [Coemansia sp. BCRC 34301]|nr:hypothetical protein GGI20_001261 [Coemansia sp. BCRC 34301]
MYCKVLFVASAMLSTLVAAGDSSNGSSMSLASSSLVNSIVPFDNLAQNLPEAFSALEDQFSDLEFRSMLTSQLNNPHAVEMFQSLIHDPSAVNSISSLLGDPKIQSSLSVQFVEQYMLPTGTHIASTSGSPTHSLAEFGDFTSHGGKNGFDEAMSADKHSVSAKNNDACVKPHSLVLECMLTILFGAIALA